MIDDTRHTEPKVASKKPRLAIHIDPDLKREFEALAEEQTRSAANLALWLIQQYVEEQRELKRQQAESRKSDSDFGA